MAALSSGDNTTSFEGCNEEDVEQRVQLKIWIFPRRQNCIQAAMTRRIKARKTAIEEDACGRGGWVARRFGGGEGTSGTSSTRVDD